MFTAQVFAATAEICAFRTKMLANIYDYCALKTNDICYIIISKDKAFKPKITNSMKERTPFFNKTTLPYKAVKGAKR